MDLKSPVAPFPYLIEVAPGLFQCPSSGAGPTPNGYHPFWAISSVEIYVRGRTQVVEGVVATYDPSTNSYSISDTSWLTTMGGNPLTGTLEQTVLGFLSTKSELAEGPLPVVFKARSGKLRTLQFPQLLGLKEIGRK